MTKEYIRFKRLEFNDDQSSLEFNDRRTIIVGENATGKSTIVQVMSLPESTFSDCKYSVMTEGNSSLIHKYSVLIEGNSSLIHKYSDLIFTNCSDIGCDLIAEYPKNIQVKIKSEVISIVKELLVGKGKNFIIDNYEDLQVCQFTSGERCLIYYAYIFAIRHYLSNIALPIIMDSPFGMFDRDLKTRLIRYLNKDNSQQILFLTPTKYDDSLGKVDYVLKELSRI